jgi:hypothetical protein
VLEEELDVAALVVEGGEAQEALGPQRRQASGDTHDLAGVGVGGEVGVGGVELTGGGGAVEGVGVDVDPGGGEGLDLGQALGPLGGVAVADRAAVAVDVTAGDDRLLPRAARRLRSRCVRRVGGGPFGRDLLVVAFACHCRSHEVSTRRSKGGTP